MDCTENATKWVITLEYNGDQTTVDDHFSTEDEMEAFDIACCLYEIDGITVVKVEKS